MKALSVITLLTLLSISCAHEAKNQSSSNSTSDSIVPTFLKQEEAALLLQKEDEHIRRWSSFDLASHTVGIEGGKQGYLQFAGAQTRNWNDEETALLQKSSQSINQIIREKELKLPFPEAVSYTHLRAHETGRNLVCRLLLEKKKKKNKNNTIHNIQTNRKKQNINNST